MQESVGKTTIGRWILMAVVLVSAWGLAGGCSSDVDSGDTADDSGDTVDDSGDTAALLGLDLGERFVVELASERGVTLDAVILTPLTSPTAAVVLLEGGDGLIPLGGTAEDPIIQGNGFLARNADTTVVGRKISLGKIRLMSVGAAWELEALRAWVFPARSWIGGPSLE